MLAPARMPAEVYSVNTVLFLVQLRKVLYILLHCLAFKSVTEFFEPKNFNQKRFVFSNFFYCQFFQLLQVTYLFLIYNCVLLNPVSPIVSSLKPKEKQDCFCQTFKSSKLSTTQ